MTRFLATALIIAFLGVALGPLTACFAFSIALFVEAVGRLDSPVRVSDGFAPSY